MDTLPLKRGNLSRLISGSALIAGTTIGAGMLGIPLVTAKGGFLPAIAVTVLVWFFMLCTGLLFLEVSLAMPDGSNVLSMSAKLLGKKAKWLAGGMFLFLYYCLMVAYIAGGGPLLTFFLPLSPLASYLCFTAVFAAIVAFGANLIDRTNMILTLGLVVSYFALLFLGSSEVNDARLSTIEWSGFFFAVPVLFSAFGYHNVIPSLCTYLKREKRTLRLSIILGTSAALGIYLLWQWLIIGSIPQEMILDTLSKGQPVTQALQAVTKKLWIFSLGQAFAFFALVTSMLGVAFSLVDFLGDALRMKPKGNARAYLTLLTFVPPLLFALLDPTIFDRALGYAGGFGEAFLNGLLPALFAWMVRYRYFLSSSFEVKGGKLSLFFLILFSLFVIGLEAFIVIS